MLLEREFGTGLPHKMMVRLEVTFANPDPVNTAQSETLNPPTLGAFLTGAVRPNGYDVQYLVGTTVNGGLIKKAEIAGRNLLSFQAVKPAAPPIVTLDLRAVAIGQASRESRIGLTNFATGRFTTQYLFNAVPRSQF